MESYTSPLGEPQNASVSQHEALWGIPEIAAFLRKGQSSARKCAADEGFPTPVMGAQRNRRWFSDEVIDYFRANRTRKEIPLALSAVTYTPSQIQIRPKKAKAA